MKKIIVVCVSIVSIVVLAISSNNILSAHAQNTDKPYSRGQEQVVGQLMVNLFGEQIDKAVSNYYKDDSVNVLYNWHYKDYKVVNVLQSEKGHNQASTYVVKFTVLPQNKHELGTDTITFGVDRGNDKEQPFIRMLSYEHNDPTK